MVDASEYLSEAQFKELFDRGVSKISCAAYIGRPYWWRPACNMTVKQFTQETIKRLVWWRGSWWVFYCNQCAAVVDQRERVGNTFPPVDAAQDRRELGTVFTAIAGPGR